MQNKTYTLARIINNVSKTETEPWYRMMQIDIEGIEGASEEELEQIERDYLKKHENDLFFVIWPDHVQDQQFNSDATYQKISAHPELFLADWWVWEGDGPMYCFKECTRKAAIMEYLEENYDPADHFETVIIPVNSGRFVDNFENIQEVQLRFLPVHPKLPKCSETVHIFSIDSFETEAGSDDVTCLTEVCRHCNVKKTSWFTPDTSHIAIRYDS